jgi:hypothetical protein
MSRRARDMRLAPCNAKGEGARRRPLGWCGLFRPQAQGRTAPGRESRSRRPWAMRLRLEHLEPRCLLSGQPFSGIPEWSEQGPAFISAANGTFMQWGACETVTVHPTDANILYLVQVSHIYQQFVQYVAFGVSAPNRGVARAGRRGGRVVFVGPRNAGAAVAAKRSRITRQERETR